MAGFRLSDERYEEIKEIVVDMFDCYQVSCVPISGFEIATKMGVIVVPYSVYDGLTQTLLLKESEDGFFAKQQMVNSIFSITMQRGMGESIIRLCTR